MLERDSAARVRRPWKTRFVARGFARCEVGHFEAELGDGAERCEHAVRRWVEVSGGVLSCGRGEGQGISRCLKNLAVPRRLLKDPQLELVELPEAHERDWRRRGAFEDVGDSVAERGGPGGYGGGHGGRTISGT